MTAVIGDKLQVTARFSLHGSVVMNVHYVNVGSAGSSDADVKDDMVTWINDGYIQVEDIQSIDITPIDIDVINLTQAYHIGSDTFLDYAGGTVVADALVSQDAGLVSFQSPTLGARGRKFIAGIAENMALQSVFGATAVSALGDYGFYFYQDFVGFATGDDYSPVSRRPSGAPGVFVYQPFTGFSVSSIVARMGSRKKGVGI
jgi:hypothetical protein